MTGRAIRMMLVPMREIYPRFGVCWPEARVIKIRQGLPPAVDQFVRRHELYHVDDPARWWLWREIKANAVAAWHYPWGFIVCCVMSLAPYRLVYYFRRFIRGK